ncbi:hypothetical protein [Bacillus sp. 166amftsu]|uniref:hypothetical protein n=1 Tax=Bacillus sp. 166amftsu TaxID=1761753 RepID=UPI000894A5C4|nr:hypothetical protein [Bacillus sp. 166amftsu]SDY93391.1 hypothetical protein SAMN04488156_10359 [Bacillus sp. 166amftsu]
MRDVTKRLQRILTELESLESDMQQTNQRKSQTDLAQQAILHTIEIEAFTTARGNHLSKELKRIRKDDVRQRMIKRYYSRLCTR